MSDLADPSVQRGLQPDATRLETPHVEGEDGEAFDMPSSYLAPEFVESGHASPAADVFSAGVILWELLANQHRPSVSGEGMLPVLDENRLLPRLSEVAEGIDPALEALVEKALKPDYRERFATVTEFRMALEDFIQERFGVAAPQSGLIPRSEALSFARMMRTGLPSQESPPLPHEADFHDSYQDFDGEDTVSRDNLPSLSNFRIPGL